jgi:SAM-dependent methyltransferase
MDATDWDERYLARPALWSDDANQFLVEELSEVPPGRALDLGCGEGRNTLWLAERGWSVLGVDFSSVAIERAKSLAEERGLAAEFMVTDAVHFQSEGSPFDLVIVFYLQLPHADVRTMLRNAAAAVAPGGTLLVVAHDLDNLQHGHGGPPSPDVLYTVEMVTEEIGALEVARAERVERVVATPDGDRVAIDTLVRAARPNL